MRGPHRLTLSALAIVTAWLGDTAAARAAVDELDGLPEFGFLHPEQDLGRAWAAAAEGDLPLARDLARAAAARAAATGHLSSEALLLHDLARLGDPAGASGRLTELATSGEGVLVAVYAQHARAAAALDPEGLEDAADRFEAIGAQLLAAEAATEAAHAHQWRGHPRRAAALHARSAALAAQKERGPPPW